MRLMRSNILRSLPGIAAATTLAVSLSPATAVAQEEEELSWYVVEIIVFERTSEIGRNAEAWPEDPGLPALADALELSVDGIPLEALEGGAEVEAPTTDEENPAATTAPIEPAEADPQDILPRAFQLVPPEGVPP